MIIEECKNCTLISHKDNINRRKIVIFDCETRAKKISNIFQKVIYTIKGISLYMNRLIQLEQ